MRAYCATAFALVTLFALVPTASAQQPGDIIITEVLVNSATVSDAYTEWFELYNNTNQPIDLHNWFVQDSAASGLRPLHQINTSLVVPAYGFVVLGGSTDPAQNGGASSIMHMDWRLHWPTASTPFASSRRTASR